VTDVEPFLRALTQEIDKLAGERSATGE